MPQAHGPSGVWPRRQDGRQSWRVLVSLAVAFAVFVALFHGLSGTPQATAPSQFALTASLAHASPAEQQDHQLPGHGAHCAHCLCHAGYHAENAPGSTAMEFCGPIYAFGDDRITPPLAGLAPFKPPRA